MLLFKTVFDLYELNITVKTILTKNFFFFFFFFCIIHLTKLSFTTLLANSTHNKLMILFLFSQKTGFDILCKLSPMETICMKYQILFSGKIRKIFQYVGC